MHGLVINIDWEYFLGLVGAIVGIAYYANGRFTKVETSLEWLKDAVRELQIKSDQHGR
jgi:hypothetical protein